MQPLPPASQPVLTAITALLCLVVVQVAAAVGRGRGRDPSDGGHGAAADPALQLAGRQLLHARQLLPRAPQTGRGDDHHCHTTPRASHGPCDWLALALLETHHRVCVLLLLVCRVGCRPPPQVHRDFRKPLVVVAPKNLLRHKVCVSNLDEMGIGTRFHRIYR